jgi:hypothetical protein
MRSNQARFIAKFIALIAVMAWFVASNHCVLSALVERMAKGVNVSVECNHCPPKDSKDGKSGGMSGCCKGIKVTASTPRLIGFDTAFSGTLACTMDMLIPQASADGVVVGVAGAGPPRAMSFAEIVLARSFQSHAPPFGV